MSHGRNASRFASPSLIPRGAFLACLGAATGAAVAALIPATKRVILNRRWYKVGKTAPQIWPDEPNKACQKDTDARWTIKIGGKPRFTPDGAPLAPISTPTFGYKSHISIDRAFGFIRGCETTSAKVHDGCELEGVLHPNEHPYVWADTAYRSAKNEGMLKAKGHISRIHHKRPRGKALPDDLKAINKKRSSVRARVEHPFAFAHSSVKCPIWRV